MWIFDHFFPLCDPANCTGEREQNREHFGREAERLQCNAGIEVDVWIELLFDEVFIGQSDLFQFQSDVEKRIVLDAEFTENLMTGLLHDLGAWIVVLVNAVTKAHQTEWIVLVLGTGDEFWNAVNRADFSKHVKRGFVCATMSRAPEAGNAGCDTRERVCA